MSTTNTTNTAPQTPTEYEDTLTCPQCGQEAQLLWFDAYREHYACKCGHAFNVK